MLNPFLDRLNSQKIYLASASANRKMIIEKSGLKFEISPSTFEENLPKEDFATSKDYVIKTSEMKLYNKIEEFKQNKQEADIIITADTIISIDNKVVEKPENREHAF
jgi:septum formation protein